MRFLKGTDEAIARSEDRLNLYKDLQYGQNREGEAIMHVSSVVNDLVKLAGLHGGDQEAG
jgi:hypothetical protein